MAVCKNCGREASGNFCANCGQKVNIRRIDAAYIVHDLPHAVFHVDKGIFYTMGQLLVRPGKAIAEYLAGKRIRHFNPFSYLLILGSVASLLTHWMHGFISGRTMPAHATEPYELSGLGLFISRISPFFDKYPSFLFLFMIPLVSLISWLYFRKRGSNYWENIILNTYLTAQFNLVLILISLFVIISGRSQYSLTPWLIVFFTYLSFGYGQFFAGGRKKLNPFVLAGLIVLVTLLYITGFSLAGVMTPWWNF